jgi:chemotaxis protein methyltransferase CheR
MMGAADSAEVERFRHVIARRLGLRLDDGRLGELGALLSRRAAAAGRSPAMYLGEFEAAKMQGEIDALAEALTVPETYFFRDRNQLHAFRELALPTRMRAQAKTRQLRVLSAGCASGEEAYSLAILGREVVDRSWDMSIVGVDLNPAMLDKARQGRYSRWSLRETPGDVRDRWFRPDGREFVLDESLRASVRFELCNLVDSERTLWRPDSYDIVFFRNVLMYFTADQTQAVIDSVSRSLKPGGYLFLGHAEALRGLSTTLQLQHTHGTFYYQRSGPLASAALPLPAIPRWTDDDVLPSADEPMPWIEAIERASARVESLTNPAPRPAPATQRSRGGTAPKWDLTPGFNLLREERFTEASAFIRSLPPEAAREPAVLLLDAVLSAQAGWLIEAEEAARRLLIVDESSAAAHYVLALCREGAGDLHGAGRHNQIAVYLDETFAMPHLHLGLMARRAGEDIVARRELEQALSLLEHEEESRLLLFGGGFGRRALVVLCRTELEACGGHR